MANPPQTETPTCPHGVSLAGWCRKCADSGLRHDVKPPAITPPVTLASLGVPVLTANTFVGIGTPQNAPGALTLSGSKIGDVVPIANGDAPELCPCGFPAVTLGTPSGHAADCPEHKAYIARTFPGQRSGGPMVWLDLLNHEPLLPDARCSLCGQHTAVTERVYVATKTTPECRTIIPLPCPIKEKWLEDLFRNIRALGNVPFDTINNPDVEQGLTNLSMLAQRLRPDMFPMDKETQGIMNGQ